MKYTLRRPNITGPSEKEQLVQMKNYLYQLVGELEFILNNLDAASNDTAAQSAQAASREARLRFAVTTNKTEDI